MWNIQGAEWPCNRAVGHKYMLESDDAFHEAMSVVNSFIKERYYNITFNGETVNEFYPSTSFHDTMADKLVSKVFTDTSEAIFYVLNMNILKRRQGEDDGINSPLYFGTKTLLASFFMDYKIAYWQPMVTIMEQEFLINDLSQSTAHNITTTLLTQYYIPLYEEFFDVTYVEVRELRDARIFTADDSDLRDVCQDFTLANLAQVTIFFEDLKEERVVQQKGYQSFNFICDIGGSLGLFFGASMVTFLEIIDFFIVQFWVKFRA
ncbi:uncharacterized protein [Ptychodera flava]|uniref:uncharacterized protein n=1 Tax=Ptychodera flava TaxID=63121 RepID=UPI00396A911C